MAGMTIEGVVEHGRRLGRELGFPTANMAVPDSVTAADGVYYSRAEVDGTLYDAMSNLGSNPSVGGAVRHLETHIFGFGGSLYGRTLRVELVRKIRDERRFATIGELRAQIARDKEYILELKDNTMYLDLTMPYKVPTCRWPSGGVKRSRLPSTRCRDLWPCAANTARRSRWKACA